MYLGAMVIYYKNILNAIWHEESFGYKVLAIRMTQYAYDDLKKQIAHSPKDSHIRCMYSHIDGNECMFGVPIIVVTNADEWDLVVDRKE